jgi:DNA-binding XRE family transcriptional regulator
VADEDVNRLRIQTVPIGAPVGTAETTTGGDNIMDWAEDLRAYRRRNFLTQAALAEDLAVDATTVSRWERGRDMPNLVVQARLRTLVAATASNLARSLADIVAASSSVSVIEDSGDRFVGASAAHVSLFRYDPSEKMGIQYAFWTTATHAAFASIGGAPAWWKNGVSKFEFQTVRQPFENAGNSEKLYQTISAITVRESNGEAFRFTTMHRLLKRQFRPGPPKVAYF